MVALQATVGACPNWIHTHINLKVLSRDGVKLWQAWVIIERPWFEFLAGLRANSLTVLILNVMVVYL
jgi:hypothetical protein